MVKQTTLDSWLLQHFGDLLKKGSMFIAKTKKPIILYRNPMEEGGESYQETVCSLTEEFVIIQVITSGGGIAPSFQQQLVFPIEEFPDWLMKKSKDLLLQCIDFLEEQLK